MSAEAASDHLRWQVGNVGITRVEEVVTYLDPTVLMPDFTAAMLDEHREWLVPAFFAASNDKLVLSIHTFVVESEGRTIVVDTCVGGPDKGLPSDPEFPDRLDAAIDGGLDAVDVVLCTHLHFDHVGWNLREVDGQRVPSFPNARYLFSATEVAHTRTDDHMDVMAPSIDPIIDAGLADLVDGEHAITGEVRLVPTPGHTPGHVSVVIESQGEHALITGDAFHTPLQVALPDLPARAFDHDADASCATRHRLLSRCLADDSLMLGTHFAPPTAGRVRRTDSGTSFAPE